ncbi:MAG: S9 family peptidase, partial [Planctomycetes bacterium]|nr:S9 family peptidase [Planctomycetota bacterium]
LYHPESCRLLRPKFRTRRDRRREPRNGGGNGSRRAVCWKIRENVALKIPSRPLHRKKHSSPPTPLPRETACPPPPTAYAMPREAAQGADGAPRSDEYRWMHDLQGPRMRDFLRANNRHAAAVLRPLRPLRRRLLRELRGWMPPDEGSAGYTADNYHYRTRFEREHEYPVFTRRRIAPPGTEEILLDENELARGHRYFACEGAAVSPDHNLLAFAVDTAGDRAFTLRIKDLRTGALLPDVISGVDSRVVWAADCRTLFYTRLEEESYRPFQVYRHRLGGDPAHDVLLHTETDAAYRCLLLPTRTRRFVLLNLYSNNADEYRFLPADRLDEDFKIFCPRRDGHQYDLADDGKRFIVRTNWNAPNFRLCEAPVAAMSGPGAWSELVPGDEERSLDGLLVFEEFVAMIGHERGLQRLFILDRRSGTLHAADTPEAVCHVWFEECPRLASREVRLGFTSLKHPVAFYDYHMADRTWSLVRREEVPGYDPDDYVTECREAPAPDGVRVPVMLVYRRDALKDGPAPLLIFGYGSYGTNIPVYFDQSRLALLERGFVYAMARVRGGGERGNRWHEDGKRLRKQNTFTDFIACVEFLVREKVARRDQLYAESLSAGGLLLGAVINRRPDLFRGIYASRPFVDPLTALADPSLPLTCFEYDEWGRPDQPEERACLRAYAPYDNIERRPYPHMLVTAAVNDSQVACWEPAKWAARLRAHNTAQTQILLRTDMAAGHAGRSGRIARLRELADLYACLLYLAGKAPPD